MHLFNKSYSIVTITNLKTVHKKHTDVSDRHVVPGHTVLQKPRAESNLRLPLPVPKIAGARLVQKTGVVGA